MRELDTEVFYYYCYVSRRGLVYKNSLGQHSYEEILSWTDEKKNEFIRSAKAQKKKDRLSILFLLMSLIVFYLASRLLA